MNAQQESSEPALREVEARRVFGLGRICRTSEDCRNVWMDHHEVTGRSGVSQPDGPFFGICRCAAGAEAGAFEYIAAMPAQEGAQAPDGLTEILLPGGMYAVFPVPSLAQIGEAWAFTGRWVAEHAEWQGFCDNGGENCDCVNTPAYEYYPPGFDETKGLSICVPLRRA